MSFEAIKKGAFMAHRAAKQRVTMTNHNGKNIRISLSSDIVDASLGNAERVMIALGSGRDAGLIRIVPAGEDGYKLSRKQNMCTMGVYPKQINMPLHKFTTLTVAFVAGQNFVEIELPVVKGAK